MNVKSFSVNRRNLLAGGFALVGSAYMLRGARAATAESAGAIDGMVTGLQSAQALSFDVEMTIGASAAKSKLASLGPKAHVVFRRPGDLLAIFGEGGPDVHLLISGGEATLFRPSLVAKAVLKLDRKDAFSAFALEGIFLPFLPLLSPDIKKSMFGDVQSTMGVPDGAASQPDAASLVAVLSQRFTGEVWVNRSTGRPCRVIGTSFDRKGRIAVSAAANYSNWGTDAIPAKDYDVKALSQVKTVPLRKLGL